MDVDVDVDLDLDADVDVDMNVDVDVESDVWISRWTGTLRWTWTLCGENIETTGLFTIVRTDTFLQGVLDAFKHL